MSIEWSELLQQLSSEKLKSSLRESKYKRLWDRYGEESGMESHEFKEFCLWARRELNAKRSDKRSLYSPPAIQEDAYVDTRRHVAVHETGLF